MKHSKLTSALALAAITAIISGSVFASYATGQTQRASSPDETAPVKHDVNMDGTFSVKDATALQEYLAGYDVAVNVNELDVNYDNYINIKDATRIQKLLAGIMDDPEPTEIGKEEEDIGGLF